MKQKIYIRADGNLAIGLGHIMRSIALAHMLSSEFELVFVCKFIPAAINSEISKARFNLILIEKEEDFFFLINAANIVILDGYYFDINYQENVKSRCGKLIFIDDLHEMEFVADLIINHAPGVSQSDYRAKEGTQYALGLDYVLLRPAFIEQARKKREISRIRSVMVCFGGGDYKNLTLSTVKAILPYEQFQEIVVITGPSYDQVESLKSIVSKDSRIRYYHSINEDEMLVLMLRSELVIVPSSGILFEALAAGCIVISGTYAENQRIIFERFLKSKVFENARNFSDNDIVKAVNSVLSNPVNPKKLIDGESGKRILRKFIELTVNLRDANKDDCELLFSWVNDPEVRMNAINTNPIEWDGHLDWFNKILSGGTSKIFILERNGIPAGQVRFDMNDNQYIIDYSVDKGFRGQGLGKLILQRGIDRIGKVRFKAVVKTENVGSVAIFESLNFLKIGNYVDNYIEYKVFQLDN